MLGTSTLELNPSALAYCPALDEVGIVLRVSGHAEISKLSGMEDWEREVFATCHLITGQVEILIKPRNQGSSSTGKKIRVVQPIPLGWTTHFLRFMIIDREYGSTSADDICSGSTSFYFGQLKISDIM